MALDLTLQVKRRILEFASLQVDVGPCTGGVTDQAQQCASSLS